MSLIDYFYPSPEKQSNSSSPEFLPPVGNRADVIRKALKAISSHQRVIRLQQNEIVESNHQPLQHLELHQEVSDAAAQAPEMPQRMIDTSPAGQPITFEDMARLQEYADKIAQTSASVIHVDFGGSSSKGGKSDQEAA